MIAAALLAVAAFAEDSLPDITVWESYLSRATIGTTQSSEPPAGRKAIRLDSVSVNLGPGRLELRGGEIVGSQQRVYQRIFRTDDTFHDEPVGWFVYHSQHGHIHFEDWTIFRLRAMGPGGSVGDIVREGEKTSFCILELLTYDSSLPGYNTAPGYSSCGQVQGLRPGRADIYSAGLTGQYIDIEGVPEGNYWLECEIDPHQQVFEANENNNVSRVPFRIGSTPPTVDDAYEQNDTRQQVDARTEGAPNSPNLGLVLNTRMISDLSLNDDDWFRVKLHAGGAGDYIKASSPYLSVGNFNMGLYDGNGNLLASSTSNYNYEYLSLQGRLAGTYYVRVYKSGTADIPQYFLEIEPGGNLPPSVTLTQPASPGVWVEYAHETFPVHWSGSDPENDPKFVSLFLSRVLGDSQNATMIPGYQDILGYSYQANVNTVSLPLGKSYVLARASDGGAYSEAWAPGFVVIYVKGDLDFDGRITKRDLKLLEPYVLVRRSTLPDGWIRIADMDEDGDVDFADYLIIASRAN